MNGKENLKRQGHSPGNAVRGSQQVARVNESCTTHIHVVSRVPPQDGGVPRVLAELRVALLEAVGLDAAQSPNGVTLPAARADGSLLPEGWVLAADTTKATPTRDFVAKLKTKK